MYVSGSYEVRGFVVAAAWILGRAVALAALAAPLAGPALAQTATVSLAAPTVAGTGTDRYMFEREAAAANGAWTISAASAVSADLVVNLTVTETGGDFVPPSLEGAQQVVIPSGATQATFNPVRDDRWDEAHGTLTVALAAGAGYTLGTTNSGTVAVRDDDFRAPPLTFSLTPAAAPVIEGVALAVSQQVVTVDDGTFTASGDLARALPGFAALRLRWGTVTHLQTTAAEISVTGAGSNALTASNFSANSAGTGLVGTRSLGNVTATADGTAEEPERLLVALERTAGSAKLLRAAAHPGADGFSHVALADEAFYRTALTVRDQPLMLDLETIGIDEGQSVAVRATMMPPRDSAFTVTVSVSDAARTAIVGSNATLSFAAGAMKSTGEVRIRAKRTAEGDGRADVTVTGTPSATGISNATATLIVSERGGSSGAVLWETELTMGKYLEVRGGVDGDNHDHYGYADAPVDMGITQVAAGSLDDATFSFQGVEYTVHRLTLTSSAGGLDLAKDEGAFVAKSANGIPLPVGRPEIDYHYRTDVPITSVNLGLEIEGNDGVTRRHRPAGARRQVGIAHRRHRHGDRAPDRLRPHGLVERPPAARDPGRPAQLRPRLRSRLPGAGHVRT